MAQNDPAQNSQTVNFDDFVLEALNEKALPERSEKVLPELVEIPLVMSRTTGKLTLKETAENKKKLKEIASVLAKSPKQRFPVADHWGVSFKDDRGQIVPGKNVELEGRFIEKTGKSYLYVVVHIVQGKHDDSSVMMKFDTDTNSADKTAIKKQDKPGSKGLTPFQQKLAEQADPNLTTDQVADMILKKMMRGK